jgi:hypothetical protein
MKSITTIIFLLMAVLLMNACQKDCPKGIQYSYKYYDISESVKQTFPYHFKDTQVWINVNTNDTLHYVLKDTISSYDTTMVSPTDGCVQNNYTYYGVLTFEFNCIEDTLFGFHHSYYYDVRQELFFKNRGYYTYISARDTIINFTKIYKEVRDRKYFWENFEDGIVRITVGDVKLYRIK